MLGENSDWISGWYLNHNGSYGLQSACNQKLKAIRPFFADPVTYMDTIDDIILYL